MNSLCGSRPFGRAGCAFVGSALLAAGMLAGCGRAAGHGEVPGPRKVRVVMQPFLSYGVFFIAQEEGYFREQGLDVEFVNFNRTDEAVPLLLSGNVDVLPGMAVPGLLNSMARGDPLRIVADKGYLKKDGCAQMAVLVRRDLPLERAAQSVRRIAVGRRASARYILSRALQPSGLSLEKLQLLDLPDVAAGEALGAGSIDAVFTGEPWISRILQAGKGVMWIPVQLAVPDFPFSFVLYGPSLLQRDPETGRRFMVAYRKGVAQFMQGKTPRNLEILARGTGETPAVLKTTCWPALAPDGRIDVTGLLAYQRWAQTQGYIDRPATAEQLWDPRFVAFADTALAGQH